jgi:carboxypeptidase Q
MKITRLLLLLAAFPCVSAEPEKAPAPKYYSEQTLAQMSRLQDAALASDYAYEQTRHLANNIGPRLSGSPQAQHAVEYVAEEMRKAGLTVRLQKVMVPHWVRGVETGEIVEFTGMTPGTTQKIVLTALGRSVATPENGLTADVVVVKSFDELTALGREKVAGKIVLFNNKFDVGMQDSGFGGASYGQAVAYRFAGASAAAKLGAVAVLVRSAGSSQHRTPHTGAMGYDPDVEKIPAAAVTYEDAETLAYLATQGKTRVHLTLTPKTLPDAPSYNVIGDLKGSEKPEEVVLVGGHLDSWDLGTGAIDDGVGVAVSMQVGYLVKKLGLNPKRTIRVIAFMNEENGGAGNKAYFEENKSNAKTQFAAIECDAGVSHSLGFLYSGKSEALPMLAPISKVLLKQGAFAIEASENIGADVELLQKAGVPTFAPKLDMRTYFKYHHTAADTFDKVDLKEIRELGSVMAVLAYGLANLEVPLPR